MAHKWKTHKVAALISSGCLTIGDGYRARNKELGNVGWPFARAGNINGGFLFADADRLPFEGAARLGNKISQPGDVVFTSKGTVGRFAFVRARTPTFVYSPQLCFWRVLDREFMEPRFLYYWMQGNEFFRQYKGVSGQTDMAEYVSLSDQRRMSLTLPGKPEQVVISRILGALDDKIELNRRKSQTLEAMARALFKSWFVDFDPVRARTESRDLGLPAEVAALFPNAFVDSEVGEVPAGWTVASMATIIDVRRGLSYKGSGLGDAGRPMHNLNSIREGGGYKDEGIKHYDGDYKTQHLVRDGDVIVANTEQGHDRRLIGYAAIIPSRFTGDTLFSQHLYGVRPTSSSWLTAHYLVHLLNTPRTHDLVSNYANGTTVNMLPVDGLQKPRVVVPPARLVAAFDEFARNLHGRSEALSDESRTLAALRDTLLPKLISGEIRVKDAESIMETAA